MVVLLVVVHQRLKPLEPEVAVQPLLVHPQAVATRAVPPLWKPQVPGAVQLLLAGVLAAVLPRVPCWALAPRAAPVRETRSARVSVAETFWVAQATNPNPVAPA